MVAKLVGPNSWADTEEFLGDLVISVARGPVSVQASSAARAAFAECLRAVTRECPFVITADVTIDIEWYVSERQRYESDATADVDNIIKPIMDALSGPEGVLVNDCQVQAITSYWMDSVSVGEEVTIRLRTPFGKIRFPKASLQFVQFGRALCFPIDSAGPKSFWLGLLRNIEQVLAVRDRMQSELGDDGLARMSFPMQRFFHRTRVAGFPVLPLVDAYRVLQEAEPLLWPNDATTNEAP